MAQAPSHSSAPGVVRAWQARLLPVSAGFALTGLVEWGIAAATAGSSGAASALPLILGLWLVAAGLCAGVFTLALRAAFGPASDRPLALRAKAMWRELGHSRNSPEDVSRLALLVSVLAGVFTFAVLSVLFIRWIILHTHGPWLMALTVVGGQVGIAVVALFVGLLKRRAALAMTPRLGWLSTRGVVGALLITGSVGFVAALVLLWPLVRAVDGPAFLLPLGAVLLATLAGLRPWPAPRWAWLLPLIGLGLAVASTRSVDARRVVTRGAFTARYALMPLLRTVPSADADEALGGGSSDWRPRRRAFTPPPGPRPNLVLVTFDALRADHTGFLGYHRPTTPHLDAFADTAAVFTRAFSQDSGTGPSLWSLMTGKTPFQVALVRPDRFPPVIGPEEKLLAEVLRDSGYATAAVLCGSVFGTPHWNLRRGFEVYGDVCQGKNRDQAPVVAARALAAVDKLGASGKPFFLWVHFYDPHGPYSDHPDIGFGDRPIDNYDEEIQYADKSFGTFIDGLRQRTGEHPTWIAITADHGEGFGEHGSDPHARNLYRNVTHVPLLFGGPGIHARHVDEPTAMSDIYPTFLDLAGVPVPEASTMASQAPVLLGEAPAAGRIVLQENSYSRPRRDTKGAYLGHYHYIMDLTTGVDELYDYVADPDETEDLMGTGLEEEALLRAKLRAFVQTTRVPDDLSK